MPTYVYDEERAIMVDKETRKPMNEGEWKPVTPMTFGDYHGYHSPITGEWIEGRRARQYDMEKHNCVDGNDMKSADGLRNERFAKKRGLEHLLK